MTNVAPLRLHRETVRPEWIDYNGHLNVAYYVLIFDHATDRLFDHLGLDAAWRAAENRSTFALEQHVVHLRELKAGDAVFVTTQLLDYDARRLHFFHALYHERDGYLAATDEIMSMHVDMATRRAAALRAPHDAKIGALAAAHRALPRPEQVGRVIGIRRAARP